MALPNVTGDIISQGFNCKVRVGTNASDAQVIAMLASFQFTEDFQVQEAAVIGHLGPVAIDPQGYNCSGSMQGFVPSKKVLNDTLQYADGGKKSIMEYVPTRAKFMDAGAIQKIAYMDFYNSKTATVLAKFEGVLITNDGMSAEGNAYVRNNIQFRALSKD